MKPLDVKTKFYNAEVSTKDILISKSVALDFLIEIRALVYPEYLA